MSPLGYTPCFAVANFLHPQVPLCPHNQRRAISPVCTSLVCISASVCPDPCGCATSMHRARMNFRRFSPAVNSLPESRAPHFGSSIMPYSAFSVVRKAVGAMFGRAPGHAWVERETENRARGLPPCQDRPEKSRIPGAGCVETGHLFSQLSSKRSAYSVVKKAVEPMVGGAPGHAWRNDIYELLWFLSNA